jgi:hypothetical protein
MVLYQKDAMATPHDQLLHKISRLPAARIAEVEDFVDFLAERERDSERQLVRTAAAASEPAFAKVWDNPEDDVYDRV